MATAAVAATAEAAVEEAPKKRSKKPLLIGLVLALVLGGGGFYATFSGLLLGGGEEHAEEGHAPGPLMGIAFVPLETIVISLGPDSGSEHLRFTAQLEVVDTAAADVTTLTPAHSGRAEQLSARHRHGLDRGPAGDGAAAGADAAPHSGCHRRRPGARPADHRIRAELDGIAMDLISDILLMAGSFGAAIYCYVLASRLKHFTTLESGMGGAIAVLSAQVDDMTVALEKARGAANGSAESLEALTARGEAVARKLELLVASLHDLPDPAAPPQRAACRRWSRQEDDRRLRFVRRRAPRDTLEAAE